MKSFGVRTIHDATHCVQRPGGLGKTTGGKREQIENNDCWNKISYQREKNIYCSAIL